MMAPNSDSEMSAGRQVSRSSPAPSGPTKVSSSQSRLMPPSSAWAAASPRQRRSRDSDGFQLEGDDDLEDHQVRIFFILFFPCDHAIGPKACAQTYLLLNCSHAYLLIFQDLVRRGGDGRYLGLSSIGPQSSFSGDSSYSFEVGGINLEELDVEFEIILEDLIASTEDTLGPDDRLLRYFCDQ